MPMVSAVTSPDTATLVLQICQNVNLLLDQDRLAEAIIQSQSALDLDPDNFFALFTHGIALRESKRNAEAVVYLRQAAEQRPDSIEVQRVLCVALENSGEKEAAAAQALKALQLFPTDSPLVSICCRLLRALQRWDEIINLINPRLETNPNDVGAKELLANLHHEMGNFDKAMPLYRELLEHNPDNPSAKLALGIQLLAKGSWQEGWALYESRLEVNGGKVGPSPKLPMWKGERGEDIILVVTREQGLGDEIQFSRFLPLARERVGRLIFMATKNLLQLPGTLHDGLEVRSGTITETSTKDKTWLWASLMSLPGILGVDEADFSATAPYLQADQEATRRLKPVIGGEGLRIGIAWQGNPGSPSEGGRSLPLHAFAPLARLEGVSLFSLQKFHGVEQINEVPFSNKITTFGDGFDDGPQAFIDTAGAMESLDLIITSDTSIAHLAGALGKPVWVALKHNPEWRWLRDREDSPWYPTMRLFRQKRAGAWEEVFERMAGEAQATFAERLSTIE